MKLTDNTLYLEDLQILSGSHFIPWEKLRGKSVVISGATGLLGSTLVDAIMFKNQKDGLECHIYAIGRSRERATQRFSLWQDSSYFHFQKADVNLPLAPGFGKDADYVLHLASNTHPVAYATDPIGTITTNIAGTQHMLEIAAGAEKKCRFVFASSNEIYGENTGDIDCFREEDLGYIDCNTLRAGYPESKRCGEALCQAYRKQKGLDAVIARFTRSYGPALLASDTKALSQFTRNALSGENIVLKSKGDQLYSYTYSADAVAGLLTVMLKGEDGEAYNIAEEHFDIRLRDIAAILARLSGTKVVFDLPDEVESAGFSKATKARLDGSKLRALGWRARYNLEEGLKRTLGILS
jgi:nucleoside-diphosphate-sugar epimerase